VVCNQAEAQVVIDDYGLTLMYRKSLDSGWTCFTATEDVLIAIMTAIRKWDEAIMPASAYVNVKC
jgi:hypothetical protein